MSTYKVPQNVEAEDKLLGPFTFRQFIYLLVVAGLLFVAWLLFAIFPLLAIIPLPFAFIFAILALPLKKDQPMETYLAALVQFYLKPRKLIWKAGQPESTILITAPKIAEVARTKDISADEATHRLSFLADLVDSGGEILQTSYSPLKDEFVAESVATPDMFDSSHNINFDRIIDAEDTRRHQEAIERMKQAISSTATPDLSQVGIKRFGDKQPITPSPEPTATPEIQTPSPDPAISNLIENNQDLSVETISKEANRLKQEQDNNIFISLRGDN
jgi:hypothetical protein